MGDWGSDQYAAVMGESYPLFSDMQTSDYDLIDLGPVKPQLLAPVVGLQPTTILRPQCKCNYCTQSAYLQQYPARAQIERLVPSNKYPDILNMDANSWIILFIFIVIVFICWTAKSIMSLHKQLKEIKNIITRSA